MTRLHICNTFFEHELTSQEKPLKLWMESHPIIMQLQFLPLLYASSQDLILVSHLPNFSDPRFVTLETAPQSLPIEVWGPSKAIGKKFPHYKIDNWEMIQTINSKVFSFTNSPKLPFSKLLHSQEETKDWIESVSVNKVLKTPFGTAGNGHIHNPNVKRLYTHPLIGEPWVERVMDFSTQWENGKLIGVTLFKNEPNGTYRETFAGEPEKWALDAHLEVAKPLIEKIKIMGYVGNLGIDAFIYLWENEKRVHPIVEINARKTMSWVALQTPNKRLAFIKQKQGLLPSSLQLKNKTVLFQRNISC